MIKNELIDGIRAELGGISTREAWTYVTFIVEEISKALEKGESVKVTNFGVFEPHDKNARIGRNPKTLEAAIISARRVIRFRMSDSVFELLNPDEKK